MLLIGRVAREEEVLPRSGKCTSSILKFGARFIIRPAFHGEISEGVVRFRQISSSYPAHERALTCLLHFFQTCVFLENDFIGN